MIHDNTAVDVALFVALLIPSVIFHEVAHGWVAERFGDPTARAAGRITLNPVPHIDPVGSIILPTLLALAGSNVFGWAKPVPVNARFFPRPTEHMAIVALAGPGSNLLLAALIGVLGPFTDTPQAGILWSSGLGVGITTAALWGRILFGALLVNAALAIFNLLPIPPLDGSRLVPLVLPERGRIAFEKAGQYGFLLLFLLLFVFEGSLDFLGNAIGWLMRVLV